MRKDDMRRQHMTQKKKEKVRKVRKKEKRWGKLSKICEVERLGKLKKWEKREKRKGEEGWENMSVTFIWTSSGNNLARPSNMIWMILNEGKNWPNVHVLASVTIFRPLLVISPMDELLSLIILLNCLIIFICLHTLKYLIVKLYTFTGF